DADAGARLIQKALDDRLQRGLRRGRVRALEQRGQRRLVARRGALDREDREPRVGAADVASEDNHLDGRVIVDSSAAAPRSQKMTTGLARRTIGWQGRTSGTSGPSITRLSVIALSSPAMRKITSRAAM